MVAPINALEAEMEARSDVELRELTDTYRKRLQDGEEDLDDLLPEAFATVREAARRVLGKRHFDVQLVGGAAMHWAQIAEMRTGEGKTLAATLPAYLNALTGEGVHIITVNDSLATAAQLRRRHHPRHQQRVRVRLPAGQHGAVHRRPGAARPPLRHRGRGRLDPGGRGPDPAHHLRSG